MLGTGSPHDAHLTSERAGSFRFLGLDVLGEEVRSMLLYVHKGHNIMDYEGRANPVVEFI